MIVVEGNQFKGHRVDELWAVIAIDAEGNEGIASDSRMGGMALVTSTPRVRDKMLAVMEDFKRLMPSQQFEMRHFVLANR